MTNLGAGFSVGSPENSGSQPQSSSSPSCERDSKQLMPPPPLTVNGVRPKVEERKAPQGHVGKGVILWIDKSLPKSKSQTVTLL